MQFIFCWTSSALVGVGTAKVSQPLGQYFELMSFVRSVQGTCRLRGEWVGRHFILIAHCTQAAGTVEHMSKCLIRFQPFPASLTTKQKTSWGRRGLMASATSPSPGGGDDMERPSSSPETIGDPESPPDSPTIESLAEEADDPSSPESAAESQDQSKRKKKKKKDRRNLEGRRQMSRSGELKTATSVDQPEATRSAGTGLGAEDIAKVAVAPNSKFVKLQSFLMKQQEDRSAAGRIERLMRSTKYDVATGVIIMVDVGLNWMDIDIRASGRDTPLWLDVSATVCLAIYTIEMIAITVLHGRRVLQDKWFLLDVVIVGSGLLQLFLSAIGISVDEVTLLRILLLDGISEDVKLCELREVQPLWCVYRC